MTDTRCSTCGHEIRDTFDGWKHIDKHDEAGCACAAGGMTCEP